MRRSPRVSVIMIFYNAERFIAEALESILAQTFEAWELLLVDDGSTDRSTAIAQEYAERFPHRVRYLEHPNHENRGMSAARNLGIQNAQGEMLAFLDADDTWQPHALEELVALLDTFPEAGMAYCPLMFWYGWTGLPQDRDRDFMYPLGVKPNALIHPPTLLTRLLRNEASCPIPSALMIRRAIVEHIGGFENSFRGLYEDQVFCAKVALSAPVVATYTHCLCYRQHPDSDSHVAVSTGAEYGARGIYLNWLERYLGQQGITDANVWRVLNRELWWHRNAQMHELLTRFPHAYLWFRKIERSPRWLRRHFSRSQWRTAVARARYVARQQGQSLIQRVTRAERHIEPKGHLDSARLSTLESKAHQQQS